MDKKYREVNMKKKTNIKTVIRKMVREEVAVAIQEVINELKQPSLSSQQVSQPQPQPQKKIIEKKNFTNNSALNDLLNETARGDDWKTMGGETYDSSKMNEVMSSQYGDMMNGKQSGDQMVASMGVNPDVVDDTLKDVFSRDYSGLVKAMDKQDKQKGLKK